MKKKKKEGGDDGGETEHVSELFGLWRMDEIGRRNQEGEEKRD